MRAVITEDRQAILAAPTREDIKAAQCLQQLVTARTAPERKRPPSEKIRAVVWVLEMYQVPRLKQTRIW